MFAVAFSSSLIGPLLLAIIGSAALFRRRRELAGTTLVAPWRWALGTLGFGALAIVFLFSGEHKEVADSHLRYLTGAFSFCPLMALLGAKRPQDRAWQFVVFTLLIVLALPSAEALLYHPDAPLHLHPAWGLLLWPLVVIGLFNALPTRYWNAALLATLGQLFLLAGQLPGLRCFDFGDEAVVSGFDFLALSAIAWGFDWRHKPRRPTVPRSEWDLVWRDFRDSFGTLWALRVADRFNAAAQTYRWNVRLNWHEFRTVANDGVSKANSEPALLTAAMEINLNGLLRRFVSDEWIAARVHCSPPEPILD